MIWKGGGKPANGDMQPHGVLSQLTFLSASSHPDSSLPRSVDCLAHLNECEL